MSGDCQDVVLRRFAVVKNWSLWSTANPKAVHGLVLWAGRLSMGEPRGEQQENKSSRNLNHSDQLAFLPDSWRKRMERYRNTDPGSWLLAGSFCLLAGSVLSLARSIRQRDHPGTPDSLRFTLFQLNEEILGVYEACDSTATLVCSVTGDYLQTGRRVAFTGTERFWFEFRIFEELVEVVRPYHFELARDLDGLRHMVEFWFNHASQIDFNREWDGWGRYCLQIAEVMDNYCHQIDRFGSRIGGMIGSGDPIVCKANAHGAQVRRSRIANLIKLLPS